MDANIEQDNRNAADSTTNLAGRLSEALINTDLDVVPESVLTKVKAHVLDQIGAQIVGAPLAGIQPVFDYVDRYAPRGSCTVIGSAHRLDAEFAGLVNATSGSACEIDDYAVRPLTHPGCEAIPAAIAVAEEIDATGLDLLRSIVLGLETAIRIGLVTMPSMIRDRGFHHSGAHAVLASAAAAGTLIKLPRAEQTAAFSIAVSHASGTTEYVHSGGEVKRLHAGLGAMGGIRAARLAALGLTAPPTILEGDRGFFQAFCETWEPDLLLAEWGQVWEFDRHAAIKPYFCLGGIHPFIDAVRQLRKDHEFSAADVDSVVLGAGPLIIRQAGATGPDPRTFLSAQFSAEFSVAMQIVSGGNRLSDYQRLEQNSFDDHEILRIARNTKLEHDQECADLEPDKLRGRVTIKTTAGAELSASAYGLGSVDNPMTPEQILEKYHELVDDLIGTERADEIAQTIMALEDVPSARKLGRLLAGD